MKKILRPVFASVNEMSYMFLTLHDEAGEWIRFVVLDTWN